MPVKKAAIKKEPVCIGGLSGAALANKVSRKLDALPASSKWLVEYYKGKLRYDKSASSKDKTRFIEELLTCTDPASNSYFCTLYKTIHQQSEGEKKKWVTWKYLLSIEDEAVLRLSIQQKKY